MNLLLGFGLYLVAAFSLIILSLLNVLPVYYLGGFVIAGFIGGLFFAWLNAWRQGEDLVKGQIEQTTPASPNLGTQAANYPCLKELIEGNKTGQACVYSGGCERVTDCIYASATQTH